VIYALKRGLTRGLTGALGVAVLVAGAFTATPTPVAAQQQIVISGQVQPGLWVDPDGCLHWVADGGIEGYMEGRVNPENGMPVCLDVNPCGVANTDTLFHTDSARLTSAGRAHLQQFFGQTGAYAYACDLRPYRQPRFGRIQHAPERSSRPRRGQCRALRRCSRGP